MELSKIQEILMISLEKFSDKISKKFFIDSSHIMEDIDFFFNQNQNITPKIITKTDITPKIITKTDIIPKIITKTNITPKIITKTDITPTKLEVNFCAYKFVKAPKSGQECGTKIRNGGRFCSKHKIYENKEQKEKKLIPKAISSQEESEKKIILRLNTTIGKHVHTITGMVFTDKKVVCGKLIDNIITPLTNDDKEVCRRYSFKITD